MAKKKLSKKDNLLHKLIPSYAVLKAQIAEDTKESNELNAHIKKFMREQELTEEKAGGYIASYSLRKSETLDPEQLLEFCHKHKELQSCIKTKEYVDMGTLEDLIYNKKFPKKLLLALDKFRIVKETEYLTVSKIKE